MNEWARGAKWPPIGDYSDMQAWELSSEISMIKKDLEFFRKSNDERDRTKLNEAQNRFNLLLKLYAERTGRSLEIVTEMYSD
jgi:hypothetical protein